MMVKTGEGRGQVGGMGVVGETGEVIWGVWRKAELHGTIWMH